MITAWEAVDEPLPRFEEGIELKVRLIRIESVQDALGRNIVGIISYEDHTEEDLMLLDSIRRRICSHVGRLS
jgi:hypothetical protein